MPDDFVSLLILAVLHHNNGLVSLLRFCVYETFKVMNVSLLMYQAFLFLKHFLMKKKSTRVSFSACYLS